MSSLIDHPTAVAAVESLAGSGARLRPDQAAAVERLVTPPDGDRGARVLVVQRTGWGKSAVYWVATALRREAGAGPTLVVSPLLSLMRDQVDAASRAGLRAATINSGNIGDWSVIEDALRTGEVDVVLVSPERLANPGFGARVLDAIAGDLGLLVIDEAHAISDWGHDFRPDYRRVAEVLQQMNPATPVLATTATANARVTDDVAAQLGEDTLVLRGPLARASLQLSVVGSLSHLQRYAWVVDHLPRLPGSGIVYALTVADVDRIVEAVRTVHGDAVAVEGYHGQLDMTTRERREDDLRANRLKALVATSALGMGYDKPDLGFVVHVGGPPTPVAYYQQIGRAGRSIDHASVVLLPSAEDARIWDWYATSSIPDPDEMSRLLTALARSGEPMSVLALEAETGIRRTRVELMVKQLAVDGSVERTTEGWISTGEPWYFDEDHYASVVDTRRREADIMRTYSEGERCLMQLLQESLDDPSAAPCGRCSVCLNELPAPLDEEPRIETARQIATGLRARTHLLEPRKMWPGGAFGSRGRIPKDRMSEPGRVLIHADAPEWADTLAAIRAGDTTATTEVSDAAVRALSAWSLDWSTRPEAVIALTADGSLGALADSVARHVSDAGQLPFGTMSVATPGSPDLSGPAEAAHWRDVLGSADIDVMGMAVLVVVDRSVTGWAATVAGSRLREDGARAVLPLLIHRGV